MVTDLPTTQAPTNPGTKRVRDTTAHRVAQILWTHLNKAYTFQGIRKDASSLTFEHNKADFSANHEFDLDHGPKDLDLVPNCSHH